jgi:CRISPR/Cas system CSM-associated protein Csm5 (group 7 of RAMP superfamily)
VAKPKQVRLIESKFDDLQDLAQQYAEVRDERQAQTNEEVRLKQELLAAMKKHKLKDYVYEDVEIHVVSESETIKVKIHKAKDEEED